MNPPLQISLEIKWWVVQEIIDIFNSKPEYGLRRVNGGALKILQQRDGVEYLVGEEGYRYLKLIKKD